jgi:hypothetical protein
MFVTTPLQENTMKRSNTRLRALKTIIILFFICFILLVLVTTLQAQPEPAEQSGITQGNSLNETTSVLVYPNPTVDKLSVEISDYSGELFIVTLNNSLGSLLESHRMYGAGYRKLLDWDMSKHSSGIYHITIRSQSMIKVYRIQKE